MGTSFFEKRSPLTQFIKIHVRRLKDISLGDFIEHFLSLGEREKEENDDNNLEMLLHLRQLF